MVRSALGSLLWQVLDAARDAAMPIALADGSSLLQDLMASRRAGEAVREGAAVLLCVLAQHSEVTVHLLLCGTMRPISRGALPLPPAPCTLPTFLPLSLSFSPQVS